MYKLEKMGTIFINLKNDGSYPVDSYYRDVKSTEISEMPEQTLVWITAASDNNLSQDCCFPTVVPGQNTSQIWLGFPPIVCYELL